MRRTLIPVDDAVDESPAAPRHGADYEQHTPEGQPPTAVNPHRPRRPREDGAALRYLAMWQSYVEATERLSLSGTYVYTGCPRCDFPLMDDGRDRLESLMRAGGRRAHRLRVAVEVLDDRFREVTEEADVYWQSASWWQRRIPKG